jgi:hypothetical protein
MVRSSGRSPTRARPLLQAKTLENGLLMASQLVPDRPRQLAVVRGADAEALVAAGDSDLRQSIGRGDRKAAQGHCFDQLEDGGVRPDAERQRDDHGQRERLVLA